MNKKLFLFFLILPIILITYYLLLKRTFPLPNPPTIPFAHLPQPTPTPKLTTILAVGDIMLSRKVNLKMIEYQNWKYPFLKTKGLLSSADVTFGNLESPITEDCRSFVTGMVFCAREEAAEGLKYAGFDILGLANNHILNHGQEGKKHTVEVLAENGIDYSDPSRLAIKQFDNLTIGFVSFDLTLSNNPQPVLTMVEKYSPQVDILVVSLHWGAEYENEPRNWQKELAHQLVDKGARIIIGHHPHVVQPAEEYNNGLIFYSLGNFVFDQMWSEETKKGKIAKIIFSGKEIKNYEEIPVYIVDFSQPQISQ